MENHGGVISIGGTAHSSTRALWQSYLQSCSIKAEGTGDGHDEFSLASVIFNMPKNLTWDRRFYFHSEGRRAADFIALKNP
jgi:hypothetical protein